MAPMCKDCSNSFYGNTCNERCYCAVGSCDTSTGVCPAGGCTAGYKWDRCHTLCDSNVWGKDCLLPCGNCLNNIQCDVFNGRCPGGCSAGYKGQLCTEPCEDGKYGSDCISNCGNCLNNATCDKQDGQCDSCTAGYKGDKCIEKCGVNTYGNFCTPCGHCLNDTPCDKQDGTCGSCAAGYTGNKCVKACSDVSYEIDCQLTCGKCHRQSICLKDTGNCHQGCEPGFLGPLCHRDITECKDGTYGEGCTSICGNCHGDEICNKQSGTCQACECGYTGHDCKGEINPASSSSDCPNIALLVGGTLVSMLAIEGVAAAFFLLIRKRPPSYMNRIRDFKSVAFMRNVWSTSI